MTGERLNFTREQVERRELQARIGCTVEYDLMQDWLTMHSRVQSLEQENESLSFKLTNCMIENAAQASTNQSLEAKVKVASEALWVAVVMLYDTHKADVLKTFSAEELNKAVAMTEPLQPRQVEEIYHSALAAMMEGGDSSGAV